MIPNLPAYICHKKVRAARILEVVLDNVDPPLMGTLLLEIPGQPIYQHRIAAGWIERHQAEIGGYFLQYEDGYTTYCHGNSFESAYSQLVEPKPVALPEIEALAGQTWNAPPVHPARRATLGLPDVMTGGRLAAPALQQAVLITDGLGHNLGCPSRWNDRATCTCVRRSLYARPD